MAKRYASRKSKTNGVFVNAETQNNNHKVLTMYMCFNPSERKLKMPKIMANPKAYC